MHHYLASYSHTRWPPVPNVPRDEQVTEEYEAQWQQIRPYKNNQYKKGALRVEVRPDGATDVKSLRDCNLGPLLVVYNPWHLYG